MRSLSRLLNPIPCLAPVRLIVLTLAIAPIILAMPPAITAPTVQNPFETSFKPGDQAPGFTVEDLDGGRFRLEDLRGKVVVLNFWFIACPPCRAEMPVLNDLVSRFEGQKVSFIGFAADPPEALREFLASRAFHYRIVPNATPIAELYGVRGAPTHIVIDQEGRFSKIVYGEIRDVEIDLRQPIEKLLGS